MPADNGPYETETQARTAAHRVISPEDGWSILRKPQNQQLLRGACETAGVELGEFDRRILDWLAGFEDSACAVIAGIIRRAGQRPEGTVTEWALAYTHTPNPAFGLPPRREVQPYPGEQSARRAVAELEALAPEDEPGLMRREVGPWTPVEEEGNGTA